MSAATAASPIQHEPELLGQTVVVIGGSAGIGLETARRARAEGAKVILTGRNPERLGSAARELDALSTTAFDASDSAALERFFNGLPVRIDHVMVTAGRPYYAPLTDLERERAHRNFDEHLWLAIAVAQHAVGRVRSGGTLLFMGGTGGRRRAPGMSLVAAATAALENRRNHLRATLPIGRVLEPADVAALAVHIMTNAALTGATYDIDGGQQLVAG